MKKTAHTIQASRDPFEGSEKDIVIDCGAIPGCGIASISFFGTLATHAYRGLAGHGQLQCCI